MGHWLVKQEPTVYPFAALVRDGRTVWDGVRNYQARNHLNGMRQDERVLYYHTGGEKAIVGLCRVAREAYPDATASAGEGWVAVDLEPIRALAEPVPLSQVRLDATLQQMLLVRQSRLSVVPVTDGEFDRILALSRTRLD